MANHKLKYSWHSINWRQVNKSVGKTQMEMVVAYRKGDLDKVYKLQYKLITSFEGRALAVRRVVTNKGRHSPGVDNILWKGTYLKAKAISDLRNVIFNSKKYKASNIKRVWIPKRNSKELRPLGIPTFLDRALQALIFLALDPIIEEASDIYSFGSRKFRGTHDAVRRLRTLLDKPKPPKCILNIDIKSCFDNISHEYINEKVEPYLLGIGKLFIKE